MSNIELLHRTRISGENLSTSQMIMFHHISAKNSTAFAKRLHKHFGNNIETMQASLINLIKEIEDFHNGLMFTRITNRSSGSMIKPLNYTLKPFLKVQKRGSEHLIKQLTENDRGLLQLLKQDLWYAITQSKNTD